jgi:hypothetical protein
MAAVEAVRADGVHTVSAVVAVNNDTKVTLTLGATALEVSDRRTVK